MAEKRESRGRFLEGHTMRSEDAARDVLPVSGDGERALQASRRTEYRAEDGGRNRAYPAGGDEARPSFEDGDTGTAAIPLVASGDARAGGQSPFQPATCRIRI